MKSFYRKCLGMAVSTLAIAGCSVTPPLPSEGIKPMFTFPVTTNETPYSQCLAGLSRIPGNHLPIFGVGEIADKTGQIDYEDNGHALSQGISEMVISAFARTRKVKLVERLDLRIPLAEMRLSEQGRLTRAIDEYLLPASDFVILGALTELNYNITSGGASLFVQGIGGGARTVVINVALDIRVINSSNFNIEFASSLQKQIFGYEVEANVFRFFGSTLVEFDAGQIRNEPLQLGVRSVVEMAAYQIMTEFLGLPGEPRCALERTEHMAPYLDEMQG
jgi:curli production assembly/transport component CsgG/holdfast attachment protein HfaB